MVMAEERPEGTSVRCWLPILFLNPSDDFINSRHAIINRRRIIVFYVSLYEHENPRATCDIMKQEYKHILSF